jgi:DNA polymerase/3'-5' exonuclease PolX
LLTCSLLAGWLTTCSCLSRADAHDFRSKAYARLANALKAHDEHVGTVRELQQLASKLPSSAGIGAGMLQHMQEIIETGRFRKLEARESNPELLVPYPYPYPYPYPCP